MPRFNPNYKPKGKKTRDVFKRPDSLSLKKISREYINNAMVDFFEKGGKIKLITEEDVKSRPIDFDISRDAGRESYEFLNGE